MEDLIHILKKLVQGYLESNFEWPESGNEKIVFNTTKKEFEADLTLVVFPFASIVKTNPIALANDIGNYLVEESELVYHFEAVKGFVNIQLSPSSWYSFLEQKATDVKFGYSTSSDELVMIEFSSPNTNKPLHLGHIRNILIGWSCSRILEAAGYQVIRTQIINDRGIAICKSMLAWKLFGNGETPNSLKVKGDQLVGKYYVEFEQAFRKEYSTWQLSEEGKTVFESSAKDKETADLFYKRFKNRYFNEYSALGKRATETLLLWEAGDAETIELWQTMNNWVYAGFDDTYQKLGVEFDKLYYESDTWKLGKDHIKKGLQEGLFIQKDDQSIWVDLTDAGMDEKILLRSNGTSVYMTQDIGTAMLRNEEYHPRSMIYVVADEQNYHFKVLFEVLRKMGEPYADRLYHLSYGMVDLPTGRMKSREGTVVDADDLIDEVIELASRTMHEKGAIAALPQNEQDEIARVIGMAALKFFILKVNPKKKMIYDPSAAIDMQGQTGPYVQNAYVRIQSILRKSAAKIDYSEAANYTEPARLEKEILKTMAVFPNIIKESAKSLDPSSIANYAYDLAKSYHRFYHEIPILSADNIQAKNYRLLLSTAVANVLQNAMDLLGIEMPIKM